MLSNYPDDVKDLEDISLKVRKALYEFDNMMQAKKKILDVYAQYCYSLGYERGYTVGHKHGETGKDDRVIAHVN